MARQMLTFGSRSGRVQRYGSFPTVTVTRLDLVLFLSGWDDRMRSYRLDSLAPELTCFRSSA